MKIARMAPVQCAGVALRFCKLFHGRVGKVGYGSALAAIKLEAARKVSDSGG